MTTLTVDTGRRLEVLDITDRVEAAVPDDADGTATVFVRHTTAGIAVNEAESRLLGDFEAFLADAVDDDAWDHDRLDGNADAHLRALLIGASETLPVSDGTLDLGTWQSVLFVECDGPRSRTVDVRV
ncbi:secondary thiamine-phosphate synthase enzyme YjbQ [Natronomonas gomsonensis]|uniref:secondary thiamine-phosphate synthase enzyme YjbQ n=1 Tax=Natronomonas gomsonensis TaxID=1046043 RepID=UPI0020CA73AA|nr:secondary thiamine-phosphate synthase enzyme YjbQ [Natronomonas gomsonensis]MCY4729113.1 secondary thiamine-phosphate synthase enzyme YjbQ [Natronomonas gomsonensis]